MTPGSSCPGGESLAQRRDECGRASALAAQLGQKPRPSHFPIAHHRFRRHFEHLRGLFHAEAAEEAELDDLRSAGVRPGQSVQRVIERHHFTGSHRKEIDGQVHIHKRGSGAALRGGLPAGPVDKDSPHHARRDGKKVRSMLPIDLMHIHQAQIRLVDQVGGLQGVSGTFVPQEMGGHSAELPINARS